MVLLDHEDGDVVTPMSMQLSPRFSLNDDMGIIENMAAAATATATVEEDDDFTYRQIHEDGEAISNKSLNQPAAGKNKNTVSE